MIFIDLFFQKAYNEHCSNKRHKIQGVLYMNTNKTLHDKILTASKEIAADKGFQAINIRAVAGKAEISVGSVYNYFPDKSTLLQATIADIWCDVFHRTGQCTALSSFHDCLLWFIVSIDKCSCQYPDFFASHAACFKETANIEESHEQMNEYWKHIHNGMKLILQKDKKIKAGIFSETFTEDDFIDFVFSNIISGLSGKDKSCSFLLKLTDKLLYD